MHLKLFVPAALFGTLLTIVSSLHGASTVPVGYATVGIKASADGAAFAVTQLSVPLQSIGAVAGLGTGRITGVSAAAISNSAAGWTANALAAANAPYFVKITSGAAVGRIFSISGNTANTLTVNTQGLDLTSLGIATGAGGDGYEIFPGYTLLSLFGTPTEGVVGGTSAQFSANQTDKILINDSLGVARFYYYDTSVSHWLRLGSSSSQDTLLISPFTGLAYYRISTLPLSFLFIGKVPDTNARVIVQTTGTTIFASYYPFASTLAALGFNSLPAWRKLGDPGVTLNDTDRVLVEDTFGVLRSYYFDGTAWKRAGSTANQNAIVIPFGTAIYCTRFGGGTNETWVRTLPYNLN